MLRILKSGLVVLAVSLSIVVAKAQDTQSILFKDVQEAQSKGVDFKSFNLFNVVNGDKHEVLREETTLQPDSKNISELYETKPSAVSITLTTEEGRNYTLNMLSSQPLAADANVRYIDNNGTHPFKYDRGVHYQGAVDGFGKSLATLSVFATGEVMMLFATSEGNFVVGKLEDKSGNYILYNDRDFYSKPPTQCGTSDEDLLTQGDEPSSGDKTTAALECKKISFYWELDYGLYANKQSSALITQSYATGMFNNVQALYRNEQIAVELKSLFMWSVPDNYGTDSSLAALVDFRAAWNSKGDNFDGDLAMLVALDPGGLGGIAYRDVLCNNRRSSYAYGDVNGSFQSVPTYSWDVSMVAHEIGHNITLRHTHWCGWNTGIAGICGSIDNCVKQESGNGCSSCTSTYDHSQPANAWRGTIMSYCHLSSRGIDLANGFGPLPGDAMRNVVTSRSCLSSIISATLTPIDICKGQGAINLDFDAAVIGTSHFGANPHTFTWSNGANTQNVSVTSPGMYTVSITDSNGCSNTFSTTVGTNNSDSCASATSVSEINKEYVSLYPNPAQDNVSLKFFSNTSEHTAIKLTDVTGRVIMQKGVVASAGENNVTLDVFTVPAGMYYILLSAPGTQYISLKLMVE